jgi:hypothetical protein
MNPDCPRNPPRKNVWKDEPSSSSERSVAPPMPTMTSLASCARAASSTPVRSALCDPAAAPQFNAIALAPSPYDDRSRTLWEQIFGRPTFTTIDFAYLNHWRLIGVVRNVRHDLLRMRAETSLKRFNRVAVDMAHAAVGGQCTGRVPCDAFVYVWYLQLSPIRAFTRGMCFSR